MQNETQVKHVLNIPISFFFHTTPQIIVHSEKCIKVRHIIAYDRTYVMR